MHQLEGLWLPRWRSDTEAHIHFVKEVLYTGRSEYQKIEIVQLEGYGKCLILDGIHQSAEADEFIYQEAITHPALLLHPNPINVLIIGAGAGNVLREVLKHPGIRSATMVDIDKLVVEKCREFLGWEQGAYEDPRTELIIMDGYTYLSNSDKKFDCIIIDSTTAKTGNPAYNLYTPEFYRLIYSHLNDGGILSGLQSNASILFLSSHRVIREELSKIFQQVVTYVAYCPFYAVSYAFTLSSKNNILEINSVNFSDRLDRIRSKLKFFDEITYQHMFSLPKYLRKIISGDAPSYHQENLIRY